MFHVEPNSQKKRLASPKDALVSGESFELLLDLDTQIAKTHPFPDENKLPSYYQHEDYISHGNAIAPCVHNKTTSLAMDVSY